MYNSANPSLTKNTYPCETPHYLHCRTREEIQEMRQTRDPITGLREKMVSSKLAEADELKRIELDIRKQVNQLTMAICSALYLVKSFNCLVI